MREILFRGKRTDNGEWTEGFLVDPSHIGNWVLCEPIHPETVGQYTGMTDKNGKKIFEGDIINAIASIPTGEDIKATVVVRLDDYELMWDIEYSDEIEVIGNIHDNPELLEVSDNG